MTINRGTPMSFLSSLPLLGGLLDKTLGLVDKAVVDKDMALQIKSNLSQLQSQLNVIEANSSSLFIAGWRPFIGWVCGVGLAYEALLRGILNSLIVAPAGLELLPSVSEILLELVFGMLGLSTLRTYEKYKNVHDKH